MEIDIAIAGGGPAGAGAACLLAQAGRDVVVFERESMPTHKICGEFISKEAQRYLERIGLDLGRLGGHPIARVRLVCGAASAEAALPFEGLGLSRRALDAALLDHAAACGAQLRRGCRITASSQPPLTLVCAASGVVPGVAQGGITLDARTVFLATGKHELRALARHTVRPPEDLIGFKSYFTLGADQARALAGHVEIMPFGQGYAGLQLIEDGSANLCLLVRRDTLMRNGGDWNGLLHALQDRVPHLQRRLQGATPLLDRPLSIYRVPYGFVHRARHGDPAHVYRLGDQAGVIASFSGDGISVALHSAALAVGAYLSGLGADAYHRRLCADIAGPIRRAGALYCIGKHASAQGLMVRLARMWPRGLRVAADATRIPDAAIERALAALCD